MFSTAPKFSDARPTDPDWIVYPNRVENRRAGTVHRDFSAKDPLPWALLQAQAGDRVAVFGRHGAFSHGIGGNRRKEVVRNGPEGPLDVTVYGGDRAALIDGDVHWSDNGHTWTRFELAHITVKHEQVGLFSHNGADGGLAQLHHLSLVSAGPEGTVPNGAKWGGRLSDHADYEIEKVVSKSGTKEHMFYWTNARTIYVGYCTAERCGRTMLQQTERWKTYPNEPAPGRPTYGVTWIENEARDCGQNGASAFTLAGCSHGEAILHSNRSYDDVGGKAAGYIVSYLDAKQMERHWEDPAKPKQYTIVGDGLAYVNGGVRYGVRKLSIVNPDAHHRNSDRDMIALAGIYELHLTVGDLSQVVVSNKTAVHLEYNGQPIGSTTLHSRGAPSNWGWDKVIGSAEATPAWRRKKVDLSAAEIDAMWSKPTRGAPAAEREDEEYEPADVE